MKTKFTKEYADFINWAINFSNGSIALIKEMDLSEEHKHIISLWFREIEIRAKAIQKTQP